MMTANIRMQHHFHLYMQLIANSVKDGQPSRQNWSCWPLPQQEHSWRYGCPGSFRYRYQKGCSKGVGCNEKSPKHDTLASSFPKTVEISECILDIIYSIWLAGNYSDRHERQLWSAWNVHDQDLLWTNDLPIFGSLISICRLMQIEIRQFYGIGQTLGIAATLVDFLISAYIANNVRFTHPWEIETSMAESHIHPKAATAPKLAPPQTCCLQQHLPGCQSNQDKPSYHPPHRQ
jgi:hypothetical protein